MKRRDFLFAAAMLAPAIRHASAQQHATKKRLAVIGFPKVEDMRIGRDPNSTIFLEELQRLGYVEGENLIVDRWQYQSGRLEEIAREVVESKPDVISSLGTPMTLRLKAATTTIPIVAATGDPIRFGLVSNLARPGGNITGVSVDAGVEVWAKRLELLSRAVPKLVNVVSFHRKEFGRTQVAKRCDTLHKSWGFLWCGVLSAVHMAKRNSVAHSHRSSVINWTD
jgi:putative ABC transport system substrate-binding protein